jgi:uncharacterized protein YhaN
MVIDKLEVKGFGRLKGLSVSLCRGINIIFGGNETGKTTLQWFVRGMLFGLKSGRQSLNGLPAPQKRFEPWLGGQFAGALTYTLDDGSTFRVERNFRTGTVQIFDSSYNNITGSFGIGRDKMPMFAEQQLGMDEMTFERTTLIRQMKLRLDESSSAGLAAKLANVSSSGYEDISFHNAERALADALRNNIGTDRTRIQPLDRMEARLKQLEKEYSRLKEQHDGRLSAQKDKLEAKEQRSRLEAHQRYLKKIGHLIEIRTRLDENLKKEAGLRDTANKMLMLESRLAAGHETKTAQIDIAGPIKRPRKKRKDWNGILAPILCLAVAVIFACLLGYPALIGDIGETKEMSLFYGIGLAVSAAAGFILLWRSMAAKNRQDGGAAAATPEKTGVPAGLPVFSSTIEMEQKKVAAELEKLSDELQQGIDAAVEMNSEAGGYFNAEELDKTIYDCDISSLESAWRVEMDEVGKGLLEAVMKEKYCEGLLKDEEEIIGELQRVEEETVAIKEKIAYLKHKGKALMLARDVLIEAGHEIKRTFAPDINRRMSGIIKGLTSGRYADLRGDDKLMLKVAVPESGDVKSAHELSGAATDQMYLALRLAMADLLIGTGESLPLFMDEVFSQFDDSRTALALKYLYDNYRDRQIVLFTCKQREVELAREICGDSINLVELGVEIPV